MNLKPLSAAIILSASFASIQGKPYVFQSRVGAIDVSQSVDESPGVSQTRFPATDANKAWPAFFKKFRSAVRTKDRTTLRTMLAPDLLFSLGHHPSDHLDDAFKFWDADGGRGWKAFNRILSQGAVPVAAWWNNGHAPSRPSRVAPAAANRRVNIGRERIDWYAIFEYSEDGNWYCVIFQQCCD